MTARCRNGRTCVAYDNGNGTAEVVGVDSGPLCEGCLNRAAYDIAELPRDYAALTAELLSPGRGGADVFVTGGDVDAPVPLALAVDELQRDIVWTLTTWEPPVNELLRCPLYATAGLRPWRAVRLAAALLASHDGIRALAALPLTCGYADGLDAGPVERDGVYALAALRELHRRADRMVGATPLTRALPGDCRQCGAAALLHVDGAATVCCGACGRRESHDDYRYRVSLVR